MNFCFISSHVTDQLDVLFQPGFGIGIQNISRWYLRAPKTLKNLSKFVAHTFLPHLKIKISVFEYCYSFLVDDSICYEVEIYRLFLHSISNNCVLFNCIGAGWLFYLVPICGRIVQMWFGIFFTLLWGIYACLMVSKLPPQMLLLNFQ